MWNPDVTVAAICEQDGRFLLVEEMSKSSGKIVFNQPAGHLEDGETIEQAVVRETLEETCCHFTPRALIGLYKIRTENHKTYLRYTFCGELSEPDSSVKLDPDILRTHWLSLEQIQSRNDLRSPLVQTCINDYLAGIRHPLSLIREL